MDRAHLNSILDSAHPLSEIGDLAVVGDILTIHKTKNVMELGEISDRTFYFDNYKYITTRPSNREYRK